MLKVGFSYFLQLIKWFILIENYLWFITVMEGSKQKKRRSFLAATGFWVESFEPQFPFKRWCWFSSEFRRSSHSIATNWFAQFKTTWADPSSRCSDGRMVPLRFKTFLPENKLIWKKSQTVEYRYNNENSKGKKSNGRFFLILEQ